MPRLSRSPLRIPAALLLLVLALATAACTRELPVREADKAVFLRATDLAAYGIETRDTEKYETFRRFRDIDGALNLEYQFETPDSETENPLYLAVFLTVERNVSDARTTQAAQKAGALGMLKWEGLSQRRLTGFPTMGDASAFHVLEMEGKPVGNYFTLRQGGRVYTVMMSGAFFDDPESWKELVEPSVRRFMEYTPD